MSLIRTETNMRNFFLVAVGSIILVTIFTLMATVKVQKKAEADYVILMKNLKKIGDQAMEDGSIVKAWEYYSHALIFGKKIKIWRGKETLRKEIDEILAGEDLQKTANGFVFFEEKWQKREIFLKEYKRHNEIEKKTRNLLSQSIAALKNNEYDKAGNGFYDVLKTFDSEHWLRNKLGNIDAVANWIVDLPGGTTTPLHRAVMEGQLDILKLLLDHRADPNIRDEVNSTPLHLAIEVGRKKAVDLLLRHNANPDVQNNANHTPLYYAILAKDVGLVKILLEHDANPNAQEALGQSLLHLAAKKDEIVSVNMLLEHGADPNVKDAGGTAPLHYAIRADGKNVASLLLQHKANPNVRNKAGRTPLHIALASQNDWAPRLLLEYGANPDTKDNLGVTALEVAYRNEAKRIEFIELLISKGADRTNLKTVLKKVLAITALQRAKEQALEIELQAKSIVNGCRNRNLIVLDNGSLEKLKVLVNHANIWFDEYEEDGSNVKGILQSAITALNVVTRSTKQVTPQMTNHLTRQVWPYGHNYELVSSYYSGRIVHIQLNDMKSGIKINGRLTNATPFMFEEENYLILQYFSSLPGVEEVIADKVLDHLVNEELALIGFYPTKVPNAT